MTSIDTAAGVPPQRDGVRVAKLYRAAWRWHFYAGLYVIPFFVLLAISGMFMLWLAWIDGRDGERISVVSAGAPLAISAQAEAALATIPGGELRQYIAPRSPDLAAIFRVDAGDKAAMVVVDPYRAEVLTDFPRRSGLYDWMDNFHGSLMLGVAGDRMLEIAASLGILLIATGVYLWFPRGGGWWRALIPDVTARGRSLWKSLHATGGFWISLVLFFFLVSGLSWSGVWGEKFVQAWSTFPAGKFGDVPLSDTTHASMNHGPKEVPWALEQTPMPASGSQAGTAGAGGAPTLDTIDALARQIGFDGRYQLNLPAGKTGVWTLSRDSMSTDSTDPTADRTVHIDRYTGKVLADIRYEDYSLAGKAMAVGIALHMGTLGLWSVLANTVICLIVLFLCLSGIVMWWRRRPAGAGRLAAPPMPDEMPFWRGAAVIGLAVAMAFPMAGLTLLAVLLLDILILSRIPSLRRFFA